MKYLSKDKLEIGCAYELHARNLRIGIWTGYRFSGIRTKFNDVFIDTEEHYDDGPPHGTAKPLRKLI